MLCKNVSPSDVKLHVFKLDAQRIKNGCLLCLDERNPTDHDDVLKTTANWTGMVVYDEVFK